MDTLLKIAAQHGVKAYFNREGCITLVLHYTYNGGKGMGTTYLAVRSRRELMFALGY